MAINIDAQTTNLIISAIVTIFGYIFGHSHGKKTERKKQARANEDNLNTDAE